MITDQSEVVAFLGRMVTGHMIDGMDLKLLFVTDDLDAAITYLDRHVVQQFGLRRWLAPRPSRWLGETVPGAGAGL
jgi:hypothetical protein